MLPKTRVGGFDNFFVAGDYVWQGPDSHGARGPSQEKALVSGLCGARGGGVGGRRDGSTCRAGGRRSRRRRMRITWRRRRRRRGKDELERSNPIARLTRRRRTAPDEDHVAAAKAVSHGV